MVLIFVGPDKGRMAGSSGGKPEARIGICEASVASIHKLAMSPRVFIYVI